MDEARLFDENKLSAYDYTAVIRHCCRRRKGTASPIFWLGARDNAGFSGV
jgi:hypothetical protein